MSVELEERLRNHAQSFDSLLSLIPAKLYYGEDVSDQWKRKKQTPEQKRAAKKAKLDPDNWKSAKDVMDERAAAAKRKRDEEESQKVEELELLVKPEQPKAIQDLEHPKSKKRKMDGPTNSQPSNLPVTSEEKQKRKAEKKAAQKEQLEKEREKVQRQKERKSTERAQRKQEANIGGQEDALAEPVLVDQENDADNMDVDDQWSTASSSHEVQDIFSPLEESASSSISSMPLGTSDQPPVTNSSRSKQKQKSKFPSESQPDASEAPVQTQPVQSAAEREAARERLANAISSFRSARKADEPTSTKPRNRAELLEQRRRKEEAKRQAKKEQRRKEREEAARKEDEEIARRFSPGGSGSLLASPRSPPTKDNDDAGANNFSYGRIEFADGSKIDSTTLEGMQAQRKKKGPQDVQTALQAAQNKISRLAGLDEQKRKTIEEKDMWLNAKRRAHGERIKDDTSLLKKALKRHEGQKKKSEKEWTERKEGVAKAQEAKQKRRTENLAKRKDEKFEKKAGKKGTKVKKRPGFEGSFRGRTGGKKK